MTYREVAGHQPENSQPQQPQQPVQSVQPIPLQPAQPKLPDYKPKGMSKIDKFAAWTLTFVIVGFLLFFAGVWLNRNVTAIAPLPHPAHSASATTPSATHPGWYVVVNTSTGYVWWLNPAGGHFSLYQARKFADHHSNYHIYALKLRK
jgi:hypothetical protein